MTQRLLLRIIIPALFTSYSLAVAAAPTTPSPDNAAHLLVVVEGRVSVKRKGWTQYVPAMFGLSLRSGDLLRLEESSRAAVACADLTLVSVPGGVSGVPCTVPRPLLVYHGSLVNLTRDQPDDFPVIVSPRKTQLLSPRPMLRWTPVAHTTSYTVSVRGPNVHWSMEVSAKTDIVYPDSAPALSPGLTYKLSVTAGGRSSDEESVPGLGFSVLKSDEAQVVWDREAKIRALGLAEPPTRFLIAQLYTTQDLSAEAIEQLEALSKTFKEPAVLRSLGDLYRQIALNRFAEERYLRALELSQKANDLEGEAVVQNTLGLMYLDVFGNRDEAVHRLQQATGLYQTLGDAKTVRQIQERLVGIQRQ
jgi:hypothetical protein